jgi:hypothetical protein
MTRVLTNCHPSRFTFFCVPVQAVMAAIIELAEELDNLVGPVCEQAQEHIHNDECVLVYGHSPLLEAFLKAAARKRRFQGNPFISSPSTHERFYLLLTHVFAFVWLGSGDCGRWAVARRPQTRRIPSQGSLVLSSRALLFPRHVSNARTRTAFANRRRTTTSP